MLNIFSSWAESKTAWLSLFMSSALLIVTALYFQHLMDLQPCIKCIYQRTAVFGILVSSLLPIIWQHSLTRLLGFIGWGVASIWGFLIAHEHVDILFAANPFFVVCDIIPNFPAFMPLHEWFPAVFGATGDCSENSWQFMNMGMAQWMRIIFATYAIAWLLMLVSRIGIARKI
ncbi:MAG: disulfide bond formation protein DsbB [Glaciecola sp.]|nr:disulfide bond formation protein DsbB [Glaciecola sp.]MDG1815117.1 disulfide bond formation protein DsbB [Glaciecola sp.]MDG2098517.1 disulfide bond formation protein DsbB [Glaciecola sp.]